MAIPIRSTALHLVVILVILVSLLSTWCGSVPRSIIYGDTRIFPATTSAVRHFPTPGKPLRSMMSWKIPVSMNILMETNMSSI